MWRNRGEIPVIKIRTFRPLANKRSYTPSVCVCVCVAAEFHQSARPRPTLARANGACIFRPTGCTYIRRERARARDPRERVERERSSPLIADEGYHLAPPPSTAPSDGTKKKTEEKEATAGVVAPRSLHGATGGNENIDGSVPARGRDNRLIIHRPRDRAGYIQRNVPHARAHMTLQSPISPSLRRGERAR